LPLLLATALGVAAPAAADPAGQSAPLDQLTSTIGDLKASLSAIRQELADMHGAAAAGEAAAPPPAQELEELRASMAAERAARQHAEAAMTGELTGLRERLAAADAAVAELHQDREALVRRIIELDAQVQEARTSEVVEALVETPPEALEPAAAHLLPAVGLMRVTQPALAAEALPALKGAGDGQLTRAASRLDLRAELALAQLRIAELSTALDQARTREEAMQAEVASLRSLTDAEIRRIMGAR
jgi:predicted  nucleic acid-binding Zn-ribbon protein